MGAPGHERRKVELRARASEALAAMSARFELGLKDLASRCVEWIASLPLDEQRVVFGMATPEEVLAYGRLLALLALSRNDPPADPQAPQKCPPTLKPVGSC